jgi:hypothetical protein
VPFATYAELASTVTSWLDRSDLSAQVPDFIRIAEATLSRRLRVGDMAFGVGAVTTVGDRIIVPTDFREIYALQFTESQATPTYLPATVFSRLKAGTVGVPKYFTYHLGGDDGGPDSQYHIHLWPEPGIDVGYGLFYYHAIPTLSDAAPSNWLLRKHPDLYLFGALLEAEPFLVNDARVTLWQGRVDKAIAQVNGNDRRMRSSGGQNRMVLT